MYVCMYVCIVVVCMSGFKGRVLCLMNRWVGLIQDNATCLDRKSSCRIVDIFKYKYIFFLSTSINK